MFNEEYASEEIWELIKDDPENLPSKKCERQLSEIASYYETTEDENLKDQIVKIKTTIKYISQISETQLQEELRNLVTTFQKGETETVVPF